MHIILALLNGLYFVAIPLGLAIAIAINWYYICDGVQTIRNKILNLAIVLILVLADGLYIADMWGDILQQQLIKDVDKTTLNLIGVAIVLVIEFAIFCTIKVYKQINKSKNRES